MLLVIGPQVWPLVKLKPSAQGGWLPGTEGAGKRVLAGSEESGGQPVPGGEPTGPACQEGCWEPPLIAHWCGHRLNSS